MTKGAAAEVYEELKKRAKQVGLNIRGGGNSSNKSNGTKCENKKH